MTLYCVRCLPYPQPAAYVFEGTSLCQSHLNEALREGADS